MINRVQVSELRAQLAAAEERAARAAKAAQDTEAAHQEVRQQQDGLTVPEQPAPAGQLGEVNLLLD